MRFHRYLTDRFLWPYSGDESSLYHWRASTLAVILMTGVVFVVFALAAGIMVAVRENVWGLLIADLIAQAVGLALLFAPRIRFEVRAGFTVAACYGTGLVVVLFMGPLSGGPIWLFTSAVLAGVLIGNWAALAAVFVNAVSLTIIAVLISQGIIGNDFPFFKTPQAMTAAIVNFVVLNAITAVSVSALLKGLNTSERQYRLMADNVADVIWTMDMNLKFTYVSPSVRQMQGFTVDEMMEKRLEEFLVPDSLDRIQALYGRKMMLLDRGDPDAWQPVPFEAEQYQKDGSTLWTSVNARLVMGRDGRPAGILGITRDITAQKRTEAETIQAQAIAAEHEKLALVGRIAGKMAHDFNNVLGIIMAHSDLAMCDCRDEETRKTFELIFSQTQRGRNLTRNLIAFARHHEPKQKWFLLNEKVEFVLDLLKTELDGISVRREWDRDVELMADPGMIEHTLVNLIQNAVHAVSLTRNPEIILRVCPPDSGYIQFEIRDNGCGIPKAYLEGAIFEPSFTLKGSRDVTGSYRGGIKGTGYGMANVRKYIELHKGEIRVASEPGDFTRVTLFLPHIEKGLTTEEKTRLKSARPQSGCAILLVEDEPAIAEVQHRMLTQAPLDHSVDIAVNGQTAMDLFDANNYDLVSLDYVLPGKFSGIDVYTHIRGLDKTIPILFISGNIEFIESIKTLKREDPCIDHLSKPCRNLEYVNSINTLLKMPEETKV